MEKINWGNDKKQNSFIKRLMCKIRGEQNVYDLISEGMSVGEYVWLGDNCIFDRSFCFLIKLGNHVTLSNNVQILAHDASLYDFIHYTKVGMVEIDDYAFVGAGSFIMPGVHIGKGAVIAARSLVTKDVPSGEVWGGSPAKKMCNRTELENKFLNSSYKKFELEKAEVQFEEVKDKIVSEVEKNKICFL